MPLDEATHRFAFLLQRDLRRLADRERTRGERGEEVRFDSATRIATWETRRGEVIGRWYADVVARWDVKDRILHWAWAGASSLGPATHAEAIAREGVARNIPQLSVSVVGELTEEEAFTLARLGVIVARGEGIEVRRTEGEVTFVGLFDSARPKTTPQEEPTRYSVPPPDVKEIAVTKSVPPPSGGVIYRSFPPPMRELQKPSEPPARIREPARAIFVPVATLVLAQLTKLSPGYQQGLFILSLLPGAEVEAERLRLGVVLVAVDAAGVLRALDPTLDLVEATARMVDADRRDGNGPWRKLSARITPKPDGGATLNVDVV